MKCPICGARLQPGSNRCPDCGCHVRSDTPAPADAPEHSSKKPRINVLVTLLGMIPVLFITIFTALISFSVRMEHEPAAPIPEYSITVPGDRTPAALPDASEGCFSIQDGAVTFLPENWTGERVLVIPQTVDGHTVTALAPGCFSGCEELTTILLPETLEHIGPDAFAGCKALRGVYLPEGMESIGAGAFTGCIGLEAIYVPASVTAIAEDCFCDCAGLLYIFYDGTFEEWNELCDDYINPFTTALCLDGNYYHGTGR